MSRCWFPILIIPFAASAAIPDLSARQAADLPAVCEDQAPPELLTWARENANPLASLETGSGFEDLEPLKRIVGGARVVGLGESVHAAREFYQVRHRLFEFLVREMGFTAFAMETGFAEAAPINEYVLGRIDEPEEWQHNWFTWGFGFEEELLDLVRWMRRYNEDPANPRKLRFYGVDLAVPYSSPLVAIEGALAYLDGVDPEHATLARQRTILPLVEKFLGSGGSDEARNVSLNRYRELSADDRNAYTAAIADLVARFEAWRTDYVARSSSDRYEWAYRHAIAARQLDNAYRQVAAGEPGAWGPPRHAAMAANVLWALAREGDEGRLAFWAHNYHVKKHRNPAIGARAGLHLASALGPDYVSIGFTFYEGAEFGWDPWQTGATAPPVCGTLDTELERVGLPAFVLDLRSVPEWGPVRDWLDRPRRMRGENIHYSPEPNPLEAFDALLHIRRISPVSRAGGGGRK